jgi:hypothetical protein
VWEELAARLERTCGEATERGLKAIRQWFDPLGGNQPLLGRLERAGLLGPVGERLAARLAAAGPPGLRALGELAALGPPPTLAAASGGGGSPWPSGWPARCSTGLRRGPTPALSDAERSHTPS